MSQALAPDTGAPLRTATRDPAADRLSLAEWLVLALVAVTFTLPARLVFPPLGAAGAPAILLGLALFLIWLLSFLRAGGLSRGFDPMRWVVAVFFLTSLAAFVSGQVRGLPGVESSSADRALISTVSLCGIALVTSEAPRRFRGLQAVLIALVAFGVLQAVLGVAQYLFGFDVREAIVVPGLQPNHELIGTQVRGEGVSRVAGTMTHYIEFGVALALMAPIALHLALFAKGWITRWVAWVAAGCIIGAVPLSVSRSGLLVLAVGLAVLAVVWPLRMKANLALFALAGAIAYPIVAPGVLGTLRALFTNVDVDPSISGRTDDYALVWQYVTDRPIFGRGLGTFIPEQYFILDNEYLMRVLNGGVIGLLGFIAVLVGGYVVARSVRRRARTEEHRHLGQALAGTMAGAAVASALFDSLSFTAYAVTLFVVVGCIGALWRLSGVAPGDPTVLAEGTRVRQPLFGDLPGRPPGDHAAAATTRSSSDAARAEPPALR